MKKKEEIYNNRKIRLRKINIQLQNKKTNKILKRFPNTNNLVSALRMSTMIDRKKMNNRKKVKNKLIKTKKK